MKTLYRVLGVLGVLLVCCAARAGGDFFFQWVDATGAPQPFRRVYLYPDAATRNAINTAGLQTIDRIPSPPATNSSVVVSNLAGGRYRAEFLGSYAVTTNWFNFPETNGLQYATNFVEDPTIYQGIPVYPAAVADSRFWQLGVLVPGNNVSYRTNGGQVFIDAMGEGGVLSGNGGGLTNIRNLADTFTVGDVPVSLNSGSSILSFGGGVILQASAVNAEGFSGPLNGSFLEPGSVQSAAIQHGVSLDGTFVGSAKGMTNLLATNVVVQASDPAHLVVSGFSTVDPIINSAQGTNGYDASGANGTYTNITAFRWNGPNGYGISVDPANGYVWLTNADLHDVAGQTAVAIAENGFLTNADEFTDAVGLQTEGAYAYGPLALVSLPGGAPVIGSPAVHFQGEFSGDGTGLTGTTAKALVAYATNGNTVPIDIEGANGTYFFRVGDQGNPGGPFLQTSTAIVQFSLAPGLAPIVAQVPNLLAPNGSMYTMGLDVTYGLAMFGGNYPLTYWPVLTNTDELYITNLDFPRGWPLFQVDAGGTTPGGAYGHGGTVRVANPYTNNLEPQITLDALGRMPGQSTNGVLTRWGMTALPDGLHIGTVATNNLAPGQQVFTAKVSVGLDGVLSANGAGLTNLLTATSTNSGAISTNLFTTAQLPGQWIKKPPMLFFETWVLLNTGINESNILGLATNMLNFGYVAAGYNGMLIDEPWLGGHDGSGNCYPNASAFPHGMAWLVARLHEVGIQHVGLFVSLGQNGVSGPGSYGYWEQDMTNIASWGVDFVHLVVDDGSLSYSVGGSAYQVYRRCINALATTGANVQVMGTIENNWEPWMANNVNAGQLWVYPNYLDSAGFMTNTYNLLTYWPQRFHTVKPGHYLEYGWLAATLDNSGSLNLEVFKSRNAWLAMCHSPLSISQAYNGTETPNWRSIQLNGTVLVIDQDPLANTPTMAISNNYVQAWSEKLNNGDTALYCIDWDTNTTPHTLWVDWTNLALPYGSYIVTEAWNTNLSSTMANGLSVTLTNYQCELYTISANPSKPFSIPLQDGGVVTGGIVWDLYTPGVWYARMNGTFKVLYWQIPQEKITSTSLDIIQGFKAHTYYETLHASGYAGWIAADGSESSGGDNTLPVTLSAAGAVQWVTNTITVPAGTQSLWVRAGCGDLAPTNTSDVDLVGAMVRFH